MLRFIKYLSLILVLLVSGQRYGYTQDNAPCDDILDRLTEDYSDAAFMKAMDAAIRKDAGVVKAWKFAFDCPSTVRTNTTILESLSNAITRGASNVLPTSSLTEITETTISHILRGNPIGHGNPTGGFHHITALIKRTDVKLADVTPVGSHGCYKAKLEFPNGNKPPKDFFPDSWDEAEVLSEIESAFPNKIPRSDLGSNTFTGVTDAGVPVYIQMNGTKMKSAFPYYE